jgi:hypothetical protein
MISSDWIAVGALFVAVASILFGYLTNRATIKARRTEIAAEYTLEAFRKLVENIRVVESSTSASLFIDGVPTPLRFKIEESKGMQAAEAARTCMEFVTQYGVYFPNTIVDSAYEVLQEWGDLGNNKDGEWNEEDYKSLIAVHEKTAKLIERIQKHIGVEAKEQFKRKKRSKG